MKSNIEFSPGIYRYYKHLIPKYKNDPFYLVIAAIGAGVILFLPNLAIIGVLLMFVPLIQSVFRSFSPDPESFFFDDFDSDEIIEFIKNYRKTAAKFGISEFEIDRDLAPMIYNWNEDDAQTTIISLIYLIEKLAIMDHAEKTVKEKEGTQDGNKLEKLDENIST